MTVLIFGAGAVGSLFAARFAQAGRRPVLLGRPAAVRAIRRDGLRVEGDDPGTVAVEAVPTLPARTSEDRIVLAVKTFDVDAAARTIARGGPAVPLLLPQNGLGVERGAVAGLRAGGWTDPERWVVRAVHSIPATLVAPGVVRAAGSGEIVFWEPARAGASAAATGEFVALFRGAGFAVRTVPDLARELWRKALVNAAINPVTALRRIPNGALASGPAHDEACALLEEARAAAASAGVAFSAEEARTDLERVVRATAGNRSSMLQDLERGRPTEIDAISGEIVRIADVRGLGVPATRAAVERVRAEARAGGAAQRS